MPPEIWLLIAVAVGLSISIGFWFGRRAAPQPVQAAPARRAAPNDDTDGPSPSDERERLVPADHLGIGLIFIDRTRRIRAANHSAERLLQSRPGALIDKSMIEAFIHHGVEDVAERARRAGHAKGEYTLSGEPQRVLAIDAWRADRGGVWIALDDVSELRRLRRIRTEFIDNLSHELRTPLTTVRLLTESLAIEAERTELPPRIRESIAKIDVETGYLVQMVNEITELSRIEGGGTTMRNDAVDVAHLIHGAVDRLRTFADRQGIMLATEVEPSDGELTLRGDEERLGQVIVNLVHNAIKFSPEGSTVTVRARPEGSMCAITVEDHGIGIPSADAERVFERFYKVDKARHRERGGTGLGLSIARHIVEANGGQISVTSEEGRGSTFRFTVPLASSAMLDL